MANEEETNEEQYLCYVGHDLKTAQYVQAAPGDYQAAVEGYAKEHGVEPGEYVRVFRVKMCPVYTMGMHQVKQ